MPKTEEYVGRLPAEIRGPVALKAYLSRVAPDIPTERAARAYLKRWQQAELAYEPCCVDCGALPEGRVRGAEADRVEFRCPLNRCSNHAHRAVLINLEIAVLDGLIARRGSDISRVIQTSLERFADKVSDLKPLAGRYTQRPVRLTLTQAYLYRFESIDNLSKIVRACLLEMEKEDDAGNQRS